MRFLGSRPPAEAQAIVRRARALLVPSRWYETFGRVIAEAYAAGVPVVASRIGALPEVVEEGVTGLLAEPDEPASWTAALERLGDEDLSLQLGEGAHRRWRERYTPQENLRQLERVYREAMAG